MTKQPYEIRIEEKIQHLQDLREMAAYLRGPRAFWLDMTLDNILVNTRKPVPFYRMIAFRPFLWVSDIYCIADNVGSVLRKRNGNIIIECPDDDQPTELYKKTNEENIKNLTERLRFVADTSWEKDCSRKGLLLEVLAEGAYALKEMMETPYDGMPLPEREKKEVLVLTEADWDQQKEYLHARGKMGAYVEPEPKGMKRICSRIRKIMR